MHRSGETFGGEEPVRNVNADLKDHGPARVMGRMILLGLIAGLATLTTKAAPFEWQTATPESHGLAAAKLEALKDALAARNTKAFLVLHDDRVLCEWYSPDHSASKPYGSASMAKAVVGGLAVGLALSDGRLELDAPVAAKWVPQWRGDARKSRITLRQLGSHTSGIQDAEENGRPHGQLTGWKGDFWKRLDPPRDPFTLARDEASLIYDPGTDRQYSNTGIAMMDYVVAAALRDGPHPDVRALLRERVFRPMEVADAEWNCGYGKIFSVEGLRIIGSWGGASFTARAAAKIGRLMLRGGDWQGRQLLGAEAVRQITRDAGTPGPNGIGWWANEEDYMPALPRDAFWGAGAGGQVVLVVPAWRLVVVRNGGDLGSAAADSLPGKHYNDVAIERYLFNPLAEIFRLARAGVASPPSAPSAARPK